MGCEGHTHRSFPRVLIDESAQSKSVKNVKSVTTCDAFDACEMSDPYSSRAVKPKFFFQGYGVFRMAHQLFSRFLEI